MRVQNLNVNFFSLPSTLFNVTGSIQSLLGFGEYRVRLHKGVKQVRDKPAKQQAGTGKVFYIFSRCYLIDVTIKKLQTP